ncbi:MAG: hypothetical protein QM647_09975 [Asticcacaulis sp.]|uniref:hypothetical protein n=1 Tax=Asticcacaulis sp. TaxID=1872648 RepID=UPI0039E68E4F
MTDYPTPKFPAFSTPEEVKAASEKVVNFWVGALSPMWVPFWAASSFGLSAWAMTQSLSKSEGLLKDVPQMGDLAKWPGFGTTGFGGVWGAAEKVAGAVEPAAEKAASVVKSSARAAPKTAKAVAEKAVDTATDTAKTAVKAASKTVEATTAMVTDAVEAMPEPKVAFDPVIEAPVAVEAAAVEAPAVLKAAAIAPVKVEPKPIARAVSAVKKPKK